MTGYRTLGALIGEARARLARAGIETPGLDARLLASHVFGCDIATMIGHPERTIDAEKAARFEKALQRRLFREPMAYITGEREFWSLPLRVTRDTLIPRPDSETLVEAALAWCARGRLAPRILDLGTGSGCLLLSLLVELPEAHGVGVDISHRALLVARENAERVGVADRAAFVCGDWASALSSAYGLAGAYDLVLCNPPYISDDEWSGLAADVRDFEPRRALRGGSDGLAAYRAVLSGLPRLLARDGSAFLELGAAGDSVVADLAVGFGLQPHAIATDLSARARCLQLHVSESSEGEICLGSEAITV